MKLEQVFLMTMDEAEVVRSKIYEVRGQKVMLDRDLAAMYGVETRALNQSVKRNAERFPNDFMFQLTDEEVENWKSQIVMSNSVKMGMRRNPYAFTELGVAMLSSVLTSKIAVQVNMGIMRAFVSVRQALSQPRPLELSQLQREVKELREYVNDILTDQNDINEETRMQLELINESIAELQTEKRFSSPVPRRKIGFTAPNGD